MSVPRRVPVVLLLYLFLGCPVEARATTSVRIGIAAAKRTLSVSLRFPEARLPITHFEMSRWAGAPDFPEAVSQVEALSNDGTGLHVDRTSSHRWEVHNQRRGFTLSYVIRSTKNTFAGESSFSHFHPTVFEDWMLAWGHGFLLMPRSAELASDGAAVEILAPGLEPVHTSWPGSRVRSLHNLADSMIAAGTFRRYGSEVLGVPLTFLVRGTFRFTDAEFVSAVTRIIEAQSRYMGDYPAPPTLVTLVEGTPRSSGGAVVPGSITVYPDATLDLAANRAQTLRLIAHENFHVWNGSGRSYRDRVAEGYYKWFQEGLTEYYASLTLLREGLIDEVEFLDGMNETMKDYLSNPESFRATADILARRLYDTPDLRQLPYTKGVLVGFLLDLKIHRRSGGRQSLDSFMRALIGPDMARAGGFRETTIRSALSSMAGRDAVTMYDRSIKGSGPLPLDNPCRPDGLTCSREKTLLFDLGFETTDGRLDLNSTVSSVRSGSPAAAAGLKSGDVLSGVSVWHGDVNRPARFNVRRGAGAATIEYMPVREAEVVRYVPDERSKRAVRSLAGRAGVN